MSPRGIPECAFLHERSGFHLPKIPEFLEDGTQIFHAGTRIQEYPLVTSGGRVFGVTAQARDVEQARNRVYQLMENIKFRGMQFRSDIGAKAL